MLHLSHEEGQLLIANQPNLKPPVTSTEQALKYKAELERIDPNVEYLMTLYLSPELTPEEIRKASGAGIAGTTSYDDVRSLMIIGPI